MSREQLKFIFSDLLPNLTGKTVLDVGSRLGPVLYAVCPVGRNEKDVVMQSILFNRVSYTRKLRGSSAWR